MCQEAYTLSTLVKLVPRHSISGPRHVQYTRTPDVCFFFFFSQLVQVNGKPRIKLSEDVEKVTMPGPKVAYRLFGQDGRWTLPSSNFLGSSIHWVWVKCTQGVNRQCLCWVSLLLSLTGNSMNLCCMIFIILCSRRICLTWQLCLSVWYFVGGRQCIDRHATAARGSPSPGRPESSGQASLPGQLLNLSLWKPGTVSKCSGVWLFLGMHINL